MKLESIKNEKFVLNTKEMGNLVGGQVITKHSGAGSYNGVAYSADKTISYTGNDVKNGILSELYRYSPCTENDACNVNNDFPEILEMISVAQASALAF